MEKMLEVLREAFPIGQTARPFLQKCCRRAPYGSCRFSVAMLFSHKRVIHVPVDAS